MERLKISTGSIWEPKLGYSRAVRVGPFISVSGTTGADADGKPGNGEYEQARLALAKIERALREAGASMADVVRTRIYMTDASKWEEVARAHSEHFKLTRPATTLVEVKALIDKAYVVEIEADAIVDD